MSDERRRGRLEADGTPRWKPPAWVGRVRECAPIDRTDDEVREAWAPYLKMRDDMRDVTGPGPLFYAFDDKAEAPDGSTYRRGRLIMRGPDDGMAQFEPDCYDLAYLFARAPEDVEHLARSNAELRDEKARLLEENARFVAANVALGARLLEVESALRDLRDIAHHTDVVADSEFGLDIKELEAAVLVATAALGGSLGDVSFESFEAAKERVVRAAGALRSPTAAAAERAVYGGKE